MATLLKANPEDDEQYVSVRCVLHAITAEGAIEHLDRITYRMYGVNGFDASGFDDSGLRGGRQKGSEAAGTDDIVIEGVGNLMTQIARCCKPVPGDDIIGFITLNSGISIHKSARGSYER